MVETTVAIAGAGPVGMSAALLLSRLGIDFHIIERRSGPQRAPAAHAINARTFEIFRQLDLDVAAMNDAAADPRDAGFVYFVERLGDTPIGRLRYENQGDDMLEWTPTPFRNLSQHRLEPMLLKALEAAHAPGVAYDQQWESATQDSHGVRSVVRDRRNDETYELRSRYLFAADGAGSRIRKWLDIPAIGPENVQSFVMIHFEASLREVVAEHPGVLYWLCRPDMVGTLVAHDIDREWVYMQPWNPDEEDVSAYTEERCAEIVRSAIGAQDAPFSIENISTWRMTAQVAERYRDGRVFLIGDSAHRFPPTGGLGLNSGVQDAHNLVWKLAAVERGAAAPGLLDTYERERRPVAQNNADQSLANAMKLIEVPLALGAEGEPAEAHHRMREILASPEGRSEVATAIENQAEHFDMLGLQLGFAYDEGALVPDGSDQPHVGHPTRDFVPSSRPGARLPHGWVERDGREISTLDLIAMDRLTILAGPKAEVSLATTGGDLPVTVLRLETDFTDPRGWWSKVAEMTDDGLLLVRPDQHVAFRARSADRGEGLPAALRRVLDHR